MKASKKAMLETKGWKVSSAEAFLDLSSEEEACIEKRLALNENLKDDDNASARTRRASVM